jgi:hypothetical protein
LYGAKVPDAKDLAAHVSSTLLASFARNKR